MIKKSLNIIVDSIPSPALLLDSQKNICAVNSKFLRNFQIREEEVKGNDFGNLVKEKWKGIKLNKLIKQNNKEVSTTIQYEFPEIGLKNYTVTARPVLDEKNEAEMVLLLFEEKIK